MRVYVFILTAAVAGCAAPKPRPVSAGPSTSVLDAIQRARGARQANNDAELLRNVALADSLAPGHPALLISLLRGYARVGDQAGALHTLERIAPFGLASNIAKDSAFSALWGLSGFQSRARQAAANAAPLVRSDTAFTVPDPDLLPESIAYDPVDRVFYLGSLSKNKVVRVTPGDPASDFAAIGQPGRIIGIKVDAPRRRLWVTTTTLDSATALHAYDLATGRLIRRYAPADRTQSHLFNDLAISAAGDVFVTDFNGNAVYRISAETDTLELFHQGSSRFHWPNGIALSPNGSRLYVAHLEGISAWDLGSGRMAALAHPDTVALADVDGLYACQGDLIAVQRMSDFEQVTRLRLSADGDAVINAGVLERRHPAYEQPTTGVIVGTALYYIANSQFARLKSDGTLVSAATPKGTVILRIPLGADCD